jgi:hypothetical protein
MYSTALSTIGRQHQYSTVPTKNEELTAVDGVSLLVGDLNAEFL